MTRQPHLDARQPVRCANAVHPRQRPDRQLVATVRYGTTALCPHCQHTRSTLGTGQPARPLPPQPAIDVLAWLRTAHQQLRDAHHELAAAAHHAHTHGHTWTTIGTQLNISRQAAQQRFKQDPTSGP
jgi:hypothetical protein